MDQVSTPIYLIVEFDWPTDISEKIGGLARQLHSLVIKSDWIEEMIAASGGLGGEYSSIWIFKLENYALLDRLFKDQGDAIQQTYFKFFSQMPKVSEKIRSQVLFQ